MRIFDRVFRPAPPPLRPDLSRWHQQELAAVWIGHATVLLRIGQMTILTDPVFSNRVGLGLGLITGGPHRLHEPAISIAQLPPIDLILVSHAHFDHLDRPTLRKLPRCTPVVTAHHTADLIHDLGFQNVTELRWGEALNVASICVRSQQVNHWGARTFYDLHRGFTAFVIESGPRRVLYGGDTAFGEHFREIGRVDLAILGIGAYDPYIRAHANPEQVWQMAGHVRAEHILPMHHSTFKLSHEPMHEPLERLIEAAGAGADRIIARQIGAQWAI